MSLQDLFYIVAIVALVIFIILTLVSIYFVLFIRKVISETQKAFVGRVLDYTKPVELFKGMASSVIGNIFLKIRDNLGTK